MHDKLDVLPVYVRVEIFKRVILNPNNGFTCNKKKIQIKRWHLWKIREHMYMYNGNHED